MKHCFHCGHRLSKEDVKFCNDCGKELLEQKKQGSFIEQIKEGKFGSFKKLLVIGTVLVLLFVFFGSFVILLFGNSGNNQQTTTTPDQTQQTITPFNQYVEVQDSDLSEIETLRQQYNSLSFDADFTQKVQAAQDYGLKAEQAIAHLNDFKDFINQNQQTLQNIGQNVPALQASIESNKAILQSNARLMATQIEQYAEANKARLQAQQELIGTILRLLIGLG